MVRVQLRFVKSLFIIFSTFAISACGVRTSIRNPYADKTAPDAVTVLQWLDASLNPFTTITYTGQPSLVASWTPSSSSDLTRQEVQLYIGSQCNLKSGAPVAISSKIQDSRIFAGLVDGSYSFKVISYDEKNNASESDCASGISVDTIAPVVAITSVGPWINIANQSAFHISGTCMDSGSGIGGNVSIQLNQGAMNALTVSAPCVNGAFNSDLNTSTPTSGTFTDGTGFSVIATVSDVVGNIGTSSAQSTAQDTIVPALEITSAPTWIKASNFYSYGVSGNCSDATSGINGNVTVTMSDGTNTVSGSSACTSNVGGTFSVNLDLASLNDSPTESGGNISITVSASDVAGNSITTTPITRSKDTVIPVIKIVSPVDQSFVKGNSTVTLNFTLTELNASNTQVSIRYDKGTLSYIYGVPVTNGSLANAPFSQTITTPNSSNTAISAKFEYQDLAGNSADKVIVNYTTELSAPTVDTLTLNGGNVDAQNNNVTVSLTAHNDLSPVTQFCLKYTQYFPPGSPTVPTAPSDADACWKNVDLLTTGISPSKNISFSNFFYQIGFVKGTYAVYAWVKNQTGFISKLSNIGAGTLNTDQFNLNYDPGTPPQITKLKVTNTDSPPNPITSDQLKVNQGDYIYVVWKASDAEGFPTNPISIFYTTDNIDYIPFIGASALPNVQGANCSIENAGEGCARLAAPASDYFKVRVVATDDRGTTVNYNSDPLNNSKLRILAGNTETGLGGSAKTALFNSQGQAASVSSVSQYRLAVSSDGKYFYIDPVYGLVWINPATGNLKVFIPKDTNYSIDQPDGSSTVASAKLKNPIGITIDYQDNLLIYDFDRIRKVNLNTMTISTMIGGGATELSSMSTVVDALNQVKLTSSYFSKMALTMIPMPNGDLLFSSPNSDQSKLNDWKFVAGQNKIEPILYTDPNLDGMGNDSTYSWNTGGGSTIRKSCFAIEFDLSTSAVNSLLKGFYKSFTSDSYNMFARIDYASGNVTNGYPSTGLNNLGFLNAYSVSTGLDGKIYTVDRHRGLLRQYKSSTPDAVTLLGKGVIPNAPCPDNTLATNCAVDLESYFVSKTGRLYFMDQGTLRTINDQKQVITLFGQFPSYNGTDGSGVVAAANARFGRIMDLKLDRSPDSNNNRLVVLDSYSGNYREVIRNGNVSQLSSIDYSWHGPFKFELEPSTGDIFSPYGGFYIKRFNKTNGWSTVVGGGTYPYYSTGDGKKGTEINFAYGYNVSLVGLVNGQLFYNKYRWDGTKSVDCMVKKYDSSIEYTQSHFLGNSTCNDGWTVGASTDPITGTSISSDAYRVEYNQVLGKYLILNGRNIFSIDTNGTTLNLLTTLPHSTTSFTHVVDSSGVLRIYYCPGNYNIYRHTPVQPGVLTATTDALPLGVPNLICSNQATLNYISTGNSNSILFSHTENGLYGVAEYFLSP
jgi:hypothetical protein